MLFNSWTFAIFFVLVYALYLLFRKQKYPQNILLLLASYIFYGFWDWRFLSLLLISTTVDFFVGRLIARSDNPSNRRRLLAVSMITNLGILGFFKYFNFFAESFEGLLNVFGMQPDLITLNLVLPVGISFYTFQSMSYTIDIYREKLEPENNFLNFALFVSFFPQLVAGPIERASRLLPQFAKSRIIDVTSIQIGLWLILWGYFQKVVIADNAAIVANRVFNNYQSHSGMDLIIGVFAFAIQIYGDFSGYSKIARGVAKLMGFDIVVNFKLPYFAKNPRDFWQRWHISLSTWLRDYLYIPLGGNRNGNLQTYRNLMITMLLGGLWHGAAWTFVIWGAYHGVLLAIHRITTRHLSPRMLNVGIPSTLSTPVKILVMFGLTLIGWLIFRAQSVDQIVYFLMNTSIRMSTETMTLVVAFIPFVIPMLIVHIFQAKHGDLLSMLNLHPIWRGIIYALLVVGIIVFGVRESIEFIYFQF